MDLNESLRSVVEFLRFAMKENETRFSADWGDLPPVTCAVGQLNQVVLNLLTNAVQAAGKGGAVRLSTEAAGDRVVVRVADDGPGVPEELRERIFEPFFTTRAVGEGTGLGLSIANTVVEAHEGTIEVEDAPGGGAVFVITVPGGSGEGREEDVMQRGHEASG